MIYDEHRLQQTKQTRALRGKGSSAANRPFEGTAHELFADDGEVPDGLVAVVSNKQETV